MAKSGTAANTGSGRRARRDREAAAARARRVRTRWIVASVSAALVAAGAFALFQQITRVQQGDVTPNVPQGAQLSPALRARGAVLTISGDDSRPDVRYDPASGTITARFQSKYYDPKHAAAYNRQYLATEGRLVVQLALHNSPEASQVVAMLFHGGQELATVTGSASDGYSDYKVQYAKGLP